MLIQRNTVCYISNRLEAQTSISLRARHEVGCTCMCTDYVSLLQVFNLERVESRLEPLQIPSDLTVKEMLVRVLRLPAVASKRYLTNKVHVYYCNSVDNKPPKSLSEKAKAISSSFFASTDCLCVIDHHLGLTFGELPEILLMVRQ